MKRSGTRKKFRSVVKPGNKKPVLLKVMTLPTFCCISASLALSLQPVDSLMYDVKEGVAPAGGLEVCRRQREEEYCSCNAKSCYVLINPIWIIFS